VNLKKIMKMRTFSLLMLVICVLVQSVLSASCFNAKDLASLKKHSSSTQELVSKCSSTTCQGKDADCVTSCFAAALEVSSDCADCFAEYGTCAAKVCKTACKEKGSKACQKCSKKSECFTTFQSCAFGPVKL
jgi:hypothetical protein